MHRLKGDLLLVQAADATKDAEAAFRRAIELARARQQGSLELRAATSLGRRWNGQGKREGAPRMRADAYGWLTEGFDTADPRAAKTLLKEVSSA